MFTKKELDALKEIIKEIKVVSETKTKVKEESKAPTKGRFKLNVNVDYEDDMLVMAGTNLKLDIKNITIGDTVTILSGIVSSAIMDLVAKYHGITVAEMTLDFIEKFKKNQERFIK